VQLIGGSEVLWVALGMAEEAAPAASSLAAVADGVGLRPEQGGDGLIGNECRGPRLHLGTPTTIKAARSPRSWPACATGGAHRGDHRSDGGPSGRSDAGYGWHIARGGGGLQGALGRSTTREAWGTDA
jgi:hypothetical protein